MWSEPVQWGRPACAIASATPSSCGRKIEERQRWSNRSVFQLRIQTDRSGGCPARDEALSITMIIPHHAPGRDAYFVALVSLKALSRLAFQSAASFAAVFHLPVDAS